ncbi:MAG: exodeoxyribonuclease VII large subunit [Pseudomonadales bacterium]|nr:exodeoxyribonuclease VII large subunit [Pseudomonadales bacterium]
MPAAPPDISQILTPGDLARRARLLIEEGLGQVWLCGELSNFRVPASGHWYFTLKDDNAQIRAAMFVNRNRFMRLKPRDGMQVLVRGRVTLYEARSDFQIIVEQIEEAGEGALQRAYEALLRKLATEGLTDTARKRPLPARPRRVAVITSATGAALQDMLSVWRRRYPLLDVVVLDVAVQGEAAQAQILAALEKISGLEADVAIIARGGGSLEDLWAFNLEAVARALAACPIPTISAIGHEIDTAITDYVADVRAPTPSAAAELCTPDRNALLRQLDDSTMLMASVVQRQLHQRSTTVSLLRARLISPATRLQQWMQRADDLAHRATQALRHRLAINERHLHGLRQALIHHHPAARLAQTAGEVGRLQQRLELRIRGRLDTESVRLSSLARTLDALSPLQTVGRGFAILTDDNGRVVTSAATLRPRQQVSARLRDGTAHMRVESIAVEGGTASGEQEDR